MFIKIKSILYGEKYAESLKYGLTFFYVGLFLLPSAFVLSGFCLIISLTISLIFLKKNLISDKWNLPFLIASFLLIVNATLHIHFKNSEGINLVSEWDPILSWLGLANWIPLFFTFYGFQPYLKETKLRRNCALILLSGTFPVVVSAIGQLLFSWYGPLETFNGLIIWYQRPIANLTGLSGLFNNPNYAGAWLNIIWPFAIANFLHFKKSKWSIINFVFLTTIFIFIILTGSRSAWLGMILSIPLLFGKRCLKWFIPLTLFLLVILFSIIYPLLGRSLQTFLQSNIHQDLWLDFTKSGFLNLDVSRLEIWDIAIKSTLENPFIGNGGSSFPVIFESLTGFWKGHAHNLPLELSLSYGLPVAFLIFIPIICLAYLSFKKTSDSFNNNLFERSWTTSLILIIICNLVDVQYFDGRISIAMWTLLAGARNIIIKKPKN